ncbi:MAG TPA: hypothetical protein VKN99_00520 [Polyangia bacterium]|nr:hypothetical protein [Polyangia bacterium]
MVARSGLVLLVIAVGCGEDLENRPLQGGPGGLGGTVSDGPSTAPDASLGDGGAFAISGRICVAGLQPTLAAVPGTACPHNGAAGATVRIVGSGSAVTVSGAGSFTIGAPAGAQSVLVRFDPGAGPLQQALLRVALPPPALVTLWTANRMDLLQLLAAVPVTWDERSTGVVLAYSIDSTRQDVRGVAVPAGFYVDNVTRLDFARTTGAVGLAALPDARPPQVSFDLDPPTDSRMLLRTHVDADVGAGSLTIRVIPLNHQ